MGRGNAVRTVLSTRVAPPERTPHYSYRRGPADRLAHQCAGGKLVAVTDVGEYGDKISAVWDDGATTRGMLEYLVTQSSRWADRPNSEKLDEHLERMGREHWQLRSVWKTYRDDAGGSSTFVWEREEGSPVMEYRFTETAPPLGERRRFEDICTEMVADGWRLMGAYKMYDTQDDLALVFGRPL